jgi:hypothetical protein
MRKAVGERLNKKKLTTTPYNPGLAKSEFPFTSLDFIPSGQADPHEHEGGGLVLSSMPDMIEAPHQEDPNAITIRIPALTPIRPLPSTASETPQICIDKHRLNVPDPENIHGHPMVPRQSEEAEKLTIKLPPRPEKVSSRPDPPESVQENGKRTRHKPFVHQSSRRIFLT